MSQRLPVVFLLCSTLLVGCSTSSSAYQRTPMTTPRDWLSLPGVSASVESDHDDWWKNFNDPLLNELIEQVLSRNADIASAAIRVRQARLQSGAVAINPSLALAGEARNGGQRNLRTNKGTTKTQNQTLTATIAYEIDLWGKISDQRSVAQWELHATMEDRQAIAGALVATTAGQYWRIANLHQRIVINEHSLRYVEEILALVRLQHEAGSVSALDVLEAEQAVASQQSAHAELLQALGQARATLALLFDVPPQTRFPERESLSSEILPGINVGLPVHLLSRRPDLRAAELRLRGSLASVDIARASFYPTLTLTGTLGASSTTLSDFLQAAVASWGTSLVLPALEWQQIKSRIGVSEAAYDAAVINFRQLFYRALDEVEGALRLREQLQYQEKTLRSELERASKIERLYRERYEAGAEPLRVWLASQEVSRAAELALANNDLARRVNLATVYQALGGSDVLDR